MDLIGHGIDLVEIQSIKKLMDRPSDHFESRCFTRSECESANFDAHRIQYFAGRFAAKEAVLKAIGTGWIQGIAWTDIEILRLPTGRPSVVLYSQCKAIAEELGITVWLLSISHTPSYAIASAIAMG
jgi:holo-[acyl-carrier protein] synthase